MSSNLSTPARSPTPAAASSSRATSATAGRGASRSTCRRRSARFGLPDSGVFANYTYLDSEIADPLTGVKRRFSRQPHHVYNFGFVQNLRKVGISFGASLSGRSSAFDSLIAETELLHYGQDLEAFLEKRLGQKLVIRFTAANILDRSKREDFRFYDGASVAELRDARLSNDVVSSERGRETRAARFSSSRCVQRSSTPLVIPGKSESTAVGDASDPLRKIVEREVQRLAAVLLA